MTNKKSKHHQGWRVNNEEAVALLKEHLPETIETIEAIAKDKKLKKSQLRPLHRRLAYRLALLGLCQVNTMAKDVDDRTYTATTKTNRRSLKAKLEA